MKRAMEIARIADARPRGRLERLVEALLTWLLYHSRDDVLAELDSAFRRATSGNEESIHTHMTAIQRCLEQWQSRHGVQQDHLEFMDGLAHPSVRVQILFSLV